MTESELMREILKIAPEYGARLFRNNTGCLKTDNGSMVRYGLHVGSSDLIGLTRYGKFLAVEVKTATGRVTKDQQHFISVIRDRGGHAFVCRSVHEFRAIMAGFAEYPNI